jgi:steroid 5-alpha reductase family enzyme
MLQAALAGLVLGLAIAVPTWWFSLRRRDASLADRIWPLLIAGPGAVYALVLGAGARGGLMLALLGAWALRLAAFITWRNWGHGEDRRYAAMRERHGEAFAWKSLIIVFGLQAVLGWGVSAPVLAAVTTTTPLGPLDAVGAALALFGLGFEAVADAQMARFRADASQRGRVMDRGLWRWSRHPNYFGECCVWWGLWLIALAGAGRDAAWTVVSPALMTFLLLRVSGVALLEKDMAERRPAYRDYIARTSAFLPWPPRRTSS